MKTHLLFLLCAALVLAGCASPKKSGEVDEKLWANCEEPLKPMYDPVEDEVQKVMREAGEKEDWMGAVPKLQKIIDDGLAEHEFAEDSILREEIDMCIFKCMVIARKTDEALKFAESREIPSVKEALAKGKKFKKESSLVVLEAATLSKYGLKGKGMAKMDAYLKRSDVPTEERQFVMFTRALASFDPPGSPEIVIKRLEETRDVDPESDLGKLCADQAKEAKVKLEELKKAGKLPTE